MATETITQLPLAISISGSEAVEIVQGGTSKQTTTGAIAGLTANVGTVTQIDTNSPITGGPITTTGTISLATGGVDNTYLAPMPANTIKGNNTGGSAAPQDLTGPQVLTAIGGAPLNSPAFTGVPTAPTPLVSDNSTTIATTAYVQQQGYALSSVSINAGTGLTGGGNLTASRTLSLASIANNTLLANNSGSSAAPSATTLTSLLDSAIGSAQGSILFRGVSQWQPFLPGTVGQVLASGGPSANPAWLTLTGTGTVQQVNTGTGLTGGPITLTGTISIDNTGVSAGSYGSSASVPVISVNAQGQITSAVSTTINAVTLTTGTITTTPSGSNDIANKAYVDSVAQGLNFHAACNYATTADLGTVTYNNGSSGVGATLTNAGTQAVLVIDGHTFTATDVINGVRILVKNQSNTAYNGVYVLTNEGSLLTNWSMVRATDYDTSGTGTNEIDAGDFFLVLSGTSNANTSWVQQTLLPIIVGTTGIVFTQFGAPVLYTAGTGLTLAGNQFSITNTAVTAASYGAASSVATFTVNAQGQLTAASSTPIAINGNQITSGTIGSAYLSGSYTGITGVGTLTAGTWNATAIGVAYGGTGLTTTPTAGQIDIGNGSGFTRTTLTQGTGMTITNGSGSITIANAGVTSAAAGTGISVSASTGAVTITNTGVTSFSAGTTGLTPSTGTTGSITLAGTLATTNGGTGLTAFTSGGAVYATSTSALTTGTLPIASGGTGQITASAAFNALSPITSTGDLIIGTGVNTASRLAIGTNGYILTSNGTTATWSAPPATGVTSFQTSLSGLTPSSSTTGAVTLAGTLGPTSGGTGLTTYATGDILYASATNTLSKLAAGTNGYILTLTAGIPSWQPNTGGVTSFSAGTTGLTPSTSTTGAITLAGTLVSANGGTGFSTYTTGDLIYASATNTLSKLGIGTNGQALVISGGVPSWGAAGGATGGGTDQIFWNNGQTVNTSYSIPSSINAGTFGPVTIGSSATVTIPSNSTWTVV